MSDNESNQEIAANAWFDDFKNKIEFLSRLKKCKSNGRSLKEEAYILCVVYLDQLSNRYQNVVGVGGRWRFYNLLMHYSGNPLFKKVYFRQLLLELKKESKNKELEKTRREEIRKILNKLIKFFKSKGCKLDENSLHCKKMVPIYISLSDKKKINKMLEENQTLNRSELELLNKKIDKGIGSIASFCYHNIRCPAIHESGPTDWSIGGGKEIGFDDLHKALNKVYQHIRKHYKKTGEFFGDKEHLFSRSIAG